MSRMEPKRSTPETRPSSGNIRFLGVEARSTSDSRRRWVRPAKTGFDTFRTPPPCQNPAVARLLPLFGSKREKT